jgi:tRNA threonylcarbamoyladenosine biosynthesis protein TsaB
MLKTILAIDSATTAGSVALCRGETLCGEVLLNVRATHSERLMVTVQQLFADTGITLNEVDAFAVVHGPGSFTGVRVGMATAKGLAMATGRPVVGVSSLQTLAMNVVESSSPVCALLDARKKEVYAGLYRVRGHWPKALGVERVLSPASLLREIDGPCLFIGEGAMVYRTLIEDHLGSAARFVPWPLNLPRASQAAALAALQMQQGQVQSPHTLNPAYIRASEAEIAWELKHRATSLGG